MSEPVSISVTESLPLTGTISVPESLPVTFTFRVTSSEPLSESITLPFTFAPSKPDAARGRPTNVIVDPALD